MSDRQYKDSEGNECTLDQLVRREPEWAVNIIGWYETKLDAERQRVKTLEEELAAARSPEVCYAPHENVGECGYCQRDRLALRLQHFREWIQEIAGEGCPYGHLTVEACESHRKHGVCRSHSAERVLADSVVEGAGPHNGLDCKDPVCRICTAADNAGVADAVEGQEPEIGGKPRPMKFKPANRRTDVTETCIFEAGHDGPHKFPSSVVRDVEIPFPGDKP